VGGQLLLSLCGRTTSSLPLWEDNFFSPFLWEDSFFSPPLVGGAGGGVGGGIRDSVCHPGANLGRYPGADGRAKSGKAWRSWDPIRGVENS